MTTRHPRLIAALCIVFFVAVFGIAAYNVGAFVWFVFVPVALCGVVNLWLLVKGEGLR